MIEIKRILACVDLSELSGTVLDHSSEAAWRDGSEIIVYSIINQRDIDHVEDVRNFYYLGAPDKNISTKEYVQRQKERREKKLQALVDKHLTSSKAKIDIKITTGYPHNCILKMAKTADIDLIVMGNRGRGGLADTLLGSIARRVIRRSPIPVLLVR